MNRVKSKLEKEYDINIKEGHFSYILNYEEQDEKTIDFCKKNNLNYYLFSTSELSFKDLEDIELNDKTLITKEFPFHSSFSILPEEIFQTKRGELMNYDYIQKIQNQLKCENIEEDLNDLLKENYKPTYNLSENDENIFAIFGHFDHIFKINSSFCLWYDNKDLSYYNYKENDELYPSNIKYSKKLSKKQYTLICSKYKIDTRKE